jgi:hypothetical protein
MNTPLERYQNNSWTKLALAGAAGGIMGAAVMVVLQLALRPYLRRRCTPGWLPDAGIGFQAAFRMPDPTSLTARHLAPHNSERAIPPLASAYSVHAVFGGLAGATYSCAVYRFFPLQKTLALGFGAILWLGATEIVLPLLSLSRLPTRSSITIQLFGLGEHLLYALTVQQSCRTALRTKPVLAPQLSYSTSLQLTNKL